MFVWKKKKITKAWLHFISPCYISCLFNKIFPLLFGFIAFFFDLLHCLCVFGRGLSLSICCTVCVCLEEVFFVKLFLLFSSFVCFVFNFFFLLVFLFLFYCFIVLLFCFVFVFFSFSFSFSFRYVFFSSCRFFCVIYFSVSIWQSLFLKFCINASMSN